MIDTVLHVLSDKLSTLKDEEIEGRKIYYMDEGTGEFIYVGDEFSSHAVDVINSTLKNNWKLRFSFLYQESIAETLMNLNGNPLKILLLMISRMKYENVVSGLTHKDIAMSIKASSRTIVRSLKELESHNVIHIKGSKMNKVYHINPAIAWKGSMFKQMQKLHLFKKATKKEDE